MTTANLQTILTRLNRIESMLTLVDLKTDIVFLGTLSATWSEQLPELAKKSKEMYDQLKAMDPESADRPPIMEEFTKWTNEYQARSIMQKIAAMYMDGVLQELLKREEQRYDKLGKAPQKKDAEQMPQPPLEEGENPNEAGSDTGDAAQD